MIAFDCLGPKPYLFFCALAQSPYKGYTVTSVCGLSVTSLVELSNGDTSFTLPTPTVAGVVGLPETVIVNVSSVATSAAASLTIQSPSSVIK